MVNRIRFRPGLAALLALGLGATAPAFAQSMFDDWDVNRDGMLDSNEFRTGFNNGDWFGDWDRDRDRRLSRDEFGVEAANWCLDDDDGVFNLWDGDDDGFLTSDEFADGAFGQWDRNRDSLLSDDEYDEGINWF